MAQLYSAEITSVVDHLLPVCTIGVVNVQLMPGSTTTAVSPTAEPSCATQFERNLSRIRRTDPLNTAAVDAATAIVIYQRHPENRILLRHQCESFWQAKLTSKLSSPQTQWRSVDVLLGRGRVPHIDDCHCRCCACVYQYKGCRRPFFH